MPSSFDQYMPKTQMQFTDGSVLAVGTIACEDQIHQAVYLSFTPDDSASPTMELELPPKTVEEIIRQLQEYANQARFVNGQRMLEYPEPYPEARGTARRTPKSQQKRKPARQPDTARKGRPPRQSPASSAVQAADSPPGPPGDDRP